MKPFKTHVQQIRILRNKGLIIDDDLKALSVLERENYYNLINGYKDFFLEDFSKCEESSKERYKEGTSFEEIYALYSFDRDLRDVLLEYLLKFETSIKSKIAYRFSEKYKESHAYLEVKNYSRESNQAKDVLNLIASMYNTIKVRGNQPNSVKHYLNKHDSVPLWVLVNYLTFGNIQYFYSCLLPTLQNKIAKDFAQEYKTEYSVEVMITIEMLEAILKTVNYFRNVCAHEERLYNFNLHRPARSASISKVFRIDNELLNKGNVFTVVAFLKLVIEKNEYEALVEELDELFTKCAPKISSVNFHEILKEMGFESNWREMLF